MKHFDLKEQAHFDSHITSQTETRMFDAGDLFFERIEVVGRWRGNKVPMQGVASRDPPAWQGASHSRLPKLTWHKNSNEDWKI